MMASVPFNKGASVNEPPMQMRYHVSCTLRASSFVYSATCIQ